MEAGEAGTAPLSDFPFQFIGKYRLSLMVTPNRQYLTGDKGSPALSFTTDPKKALVLALYAASSAGERDKGVILQVTHESVPMPGGFIGVPGLEGAVYALGTVDYRNATVFGMQMPAQGQIRLRHRKADRYLMAVMASSGMTLWLPPQGFFDEQPWQLDPVQLWNPQTMENADLRYVRGLRHLDVTRLSFAGAQLLQADFAGAKLMNCNFRNARCEQAGFIGADLSGANFTGANVTGAQFGGVSAVEAKFPGVRFSKGSFDSRYGLPSFERATLSSAVFDDCDLSGVKFVGAKLDKASLKKAKLRGTDLSRADLAEARLDDADAFNAIFASSGMTGATLARANLVGANFQKAVLTRACFEDAKLARLGGKNADFTDAVLYEIDFSGCDLRYVVIAGRPNFHKEAGAVPDEKTRRALFRRARVPLALIGEKNWRMLDLSEASIEGDLSTMKDFRAEYTIFPNGFALCEGIDLTGAKFNYARMVRIKLHQAVSSADSADPATITDFTGADLRRAQLPGAFLEAAIFSRAILHGVNLSNAQLSYARFDSARLDSIADKEGGSTLPIRANLSYAVLLNADFSRAYLDRGTESTHGANLGGVKFYGLDAKVTEATLNGADFSGAYLGGVDFSGAKAMDSVIFAMACLVNCKFNGVLMRQAQLNGACLLGADFTDAKLDGASMAKALVADAPRSGTQNTLKVIGIGGGLSLEYGRTKVSGNATSRETTCPSGMNGPCEEAHWQRVTGPREWVYRSRGA